MDEAMNQSSKKNWWVWLVVAVIVVVAVIFYLRSGTPIPSGDSATEALQQLGTSDEVTAIEQDLGATDLSDLDKELSDIEAELGK